MTFDEIFGMLQDQDPKKMISNALEELKQSVVDAAAEAGKASRAYYADAEDKQKKITSRIELLKKQRNTFQAQIEALKKPLLSATVSGNAQKLTELKASMKALEADKIQVSTELEMLESAHMSGADELYNDVVKKNDRYAAALDAYQKSMRKVYEFALKREETYNTIHRETQFYSTIPAYGPKMEELRKHYNFDEQERIRAEVARQEAALEAERANKPRNLETNRWIF